MDIDRSKKVPVYWQIKEIIHDQIISGELKPGDQLLSEPKLAAQYDVNRLTVRSAITELVNSGYLYRVHGHGTFVSKPRVESASSNITSFKDDMEKRGYEVHSDILAAQKIRAEDAIHDLLGLKHGDWVYYIRRLRYANNEPIVLQDSHIPCRLCKGLLDEDLERESLYGILRKRYHLEIANARESLEACKAAQAQAALLGIAVGDPVLYSKRLAALESGEFLEYTTSWYRGDRYIFEVKLQ